MDFVGTVKCHVSVTKSIFNTFYYIVKVKIRVKGQIILSEDPDIFSFILGSTIQINVFRYICRHTCTSLIWLLFCSIISYK